MKAWMWVIIMAVVALLIAPAMSGADTPNMERKIIIYKSGVTDDVQKMVLQRHGAAKLKDLSLINGQSVVLTPGAAAKLMRESAVLRVEDDVEIQAQAQVLPWGVDRIDAEKAWVRTTGDPVKVAVLDTGVDLKHPDLAANIKGGKSFVAYTTKYSDDNGHGTHVAGIIAALGNTIGVVGVGPKIDLYAVKVLNRLGSGYVSDVISGLEWCVANGMQVVNMSLGSSSYSQALADAVYNVNAANIVQVAAAGNNYGGQVLYPAKFPEVIAVTATDSTNKIASFSSVGPEVDLAAPGVSIYSTYRGASYKTLSGTSMAAPHVAGSAALVIDTGNADYDGNGVVTPDEVKQKLQETATDLGDPGADPTYGAGLANADLATQ